MGVTTIEGKSGYGLDFDTEIKQLKIMKLLNSTHSIDIKTTFLGAHAIPLEYKNNSNQYIYYIIKNVLPFVVEKRLAEFCDIFCENSVFSIEQSKKLLLKAKEMGMKLKIHADEFGPSRGAELASEMGAISADHLLNISKRGIKSLANNGPIAVLLPGTAFCLRKSFPNAREMIDNNCAIALATDFNPGSCFTESIPLIFALAIICMNMTIEETVTAFTINGAAAIGKADEVGSLDIGKKGDLIS